MTSSVRSLNQQQATTERFSMTEAIKKRLLKQFWMRDY